MPEALKRIWPAKSTPSQWIHRPIADGRREVDNHEQEPWKLPLPAFFQSLYQKHFGKDRPDVVHSIEERVRLLEQKKAPKRERKRLRREAAP